MEQITSSDIQFGDQYSKESMRRLAQEFRKVVTQLNAAISAINDLQARVTKLEHP